MTKVVQPYFNGESYSCPCCGAFSQMIWNQMILPNGNSTDFHIVYCQSCKRPQVWMDLKQYLPKLNQHYEYRKIIYPEISIVPRPSDDIPEDIKPDYQEAANIYQKSPRGSAALLRLCLQKLCKHLGGTGKNINDDLAYLAKKELVSSKIIRAADVVRITGNEAVHPGTIDDKDFDGIAIKLFDLINIIVRQGITEQKEIDSLFNMMPEKKRQEAENRDKPKNNQQSQHRGNKKPA